MLSGLELGKLAYEQWGRHGVPVFPCNDAKQPLCKWRKDASCDEEEICRLFESRGPTARHIGAAMGNQSGLFAVDFDLYKGTGARDYMQTLLVAGVLPTTRVHETKSGGLHYLYFVPDGQPVPRNSVPCDGVEIRGEGGYIIVPPSAGYKVVSAGTVEAPVGLLKRIKRSDDAFRALSVSKLVEKILAGDNFHEALLGIAAKMHSRGASPEEVTKTMTDAMMGSVAANPRHERHGRWHSIMSGGDGELARISTSAYKKYNPARDEVDTAQGMSRLKGVIRADKVEGFFGPKPADETEGLGSSATPEALEAVDAFPFENSYGAADVENEENKVFLLHPLIMEGDVVVLSAEPKAGKTLTAMNLCLHAAAGLSIGDELTPLDKEGNKAKLAIIYFALEGQGAIRKRIKAWLKEQKGGMTMEDLHLYIVERPMNLGSDEEKQIIVDKIALANAYFQKIGWGELKMVVFDTLTKAMPGKDQNSVEDTSAVFQTVDMLREMDIGCAVMFIHHNNKNSKSPRGSGNIMAEPDTILAVRKADAVVVDGETLPCHELSVYMARSIDDGLVYRFGARDVEIGLNSQGIMESAPVLTLVDNYESKVKPAELSVRNAADKAKEVFYTLLWDSLSKQSSMFLTFSQLRRTMERSVGAASYLNSHLNDNTKSGAKAAWSVLTAQEQLPENLVGTVSFVVDDNGVTLHLGELGDEVTKEVNDA